MFLLILFAGIIVFVSPLFKGFATAQSPLLMLVIIGFVIYLIFRFSKLAIKGYSGTNRIRREKYDADYSKAKRNTERGRAYAETKKMKNDKIFERNKAKRNRKEKAIKRQEIKAIKKSEGKKNEKKN